MSSKSILELYPQALKELITPLPAVKTNKFEKLDRYTNGLRPREFTILCGSTGIGKTTFLANLSLAFLEQGHKHFVMSVETGPLDFVKRVLSAAEEMNINTGDVQDIEIVKALDRKHSHLFLADNLRLSLFEDRVKCETLIDEIKRKVHEFGAKIVMIDNLNFFMEPTSAINQNIEMDRVTHALIMLCKQIDVHIVMVMHPRKTESRRVEDEFDIKGSSTAVQEAHNIWLLNRPSQELLENSAYGFTRTDRELTIQKVRRFGKYQGNKIMFKQTDGVTYREGKEIEPYV